ncbi:hypothetical protein G9P44_003358 [Scheffersomyces stipitis]|nr:hypothetical protein G9P44_003358 [Scheffersomyces stipitis]
MSSQLEKITKSLENISIDPDSKDQQEETPLIVLQDEHSPDIDPDSSKLSSVDEKTVQLVQLVADYEQRANHSFRLNYINGFLNLSRANYNAGSFSKRFGSDKFDLRPYKACKDIVFDAKSLRFTVTDRLAQQKAAESKPAKISRTSSYNEKIADITESHEIEMDEIVKSRTTSSKRNTGLGGLKNRRTTEKDRTSEKDSNYSDHNEKIKLTDPIYQFGALTPYQLKQAQGFFSSALEDSVELANIQKQIEALIGEITELQKSEPKEKIQSET